VAHVVPNGGPIKESKEEKGAQAKGEGCQVWDKHSKDVCPVKADWNSPGTGLVDLMVAKVEHIGLGAAVFGSKCVVPMSLMVGYHGYQSSGLPCHM